MSIDNYPTEHSWLHVFCILALYNPTKVAIQNAIVDRKDADEILVEYKQCLVNPKVCATTNHYSCLFPPFLLFSSFFL